MCSLSPSPNLKNKKEIINPGLCEASEVLGGGCVPVFLGRKAERLKPETCHYPNLLWNSTMHEVEDATALPSFHFIL